MFIGARSMGLIQKGSAKYNIETEFFLENSVSVERFFNISQYSKEGGMWQEQDHTLATYFD